KPLEKIRITMPRNSVTRKGMVFTNMTDTPFLGQIKCFEKWPMQLVAKAFSSEPWNQFLDGIRFAEGLPIMDSAKNIFYDPIAPLPMNTVVRADANGTVPLWLTVSSKGLQPGTYTGQIVIKGAYPGFGTQVIALETKVIAADPEEYKGINMSFTYMMSPKAKASHARFLADHGMNTIYSSPPGYPEMNEDGTIGETDYSHFDANLRICFANGFDPKTCHVIFYMAMERKWAMLHKGKARFPYGTPQFEKAFKLFLLDLARHLEETFGITQEQLILYPCDEPGGEWDDPDDSMNIAWNAGNWIKDTLPKVRRFIDPYPFGPRRKKCSEETLNKIFGLFDIVMLHRPANVLPDVVAIAKKHNCTIWTYGIVDKVTHPAVYRRFFWQNLKDGLGSTAAFWHMDAHAGGDGFDSFDSHGYNPKSRADYGAIYTDWNYGTILSGRRFDAWCDGFTDYRLAQLCLQAIEALPDRDTRAKQLQSIFETASEGGINEMEAGRTKLLKLYEEIKK
ncbi:MAG TPA: hypothetical protein PKV86_12835, partial [Syntrophobacteraceae bacterium]|nr:hypothetical protein [Syntrophobacteraceae bacterium]